MVARRLPSRRPSGFLAGLALAGLGVGVLAGAAASPAGAATVSTSWVSLINNNQEECLATGLAAVQALGFRGSVSGDRQAIFGWRSDETLTVRCIATHELALRKPCAGPDRLHCGSRGLGPEARAYCVWARI